MNAPDPMPAAPVAEPNAILRDLWYFAMPGSALAPGQMLAKKLLGQSMLFARTSEGEVFALLDYCPHRGLPFRHGRFDGHEVECAYHGWRFNSKGTCSGIPALVEGQALDVSRIKTRRFIVREVQGNIWVLNGEDESVAPPIPILPDIGDLRPGLVAQVMMPGPLDHAVIGLMDPAHGPFVHQAWWWRSTRSIHAKAKLYGPADFGFAMLRHAPSTNSFAYKLLGGGISTEISFRLPSLRIEHIQAGRQTIIGFTACTPIDPQSTELTQLFYWTTPWLNLLTWLLRPFIRTFLEQDRSIMEKQQEGLKLGLPLMLIDDSDRPAKWYYRLKREWQMSRAEGRPFVNPVKPVTLRWRS